MHFILMFKVKTQQHLLAYRDCPNIHERNDRHLKVSCLHLHLSRT